MIMILFTIEEVLLSIVKTYYYLLLFFGLYFFSIRRSIFLSNTVRPVGGVEDADGVDDARTSGLYAPTGP